MVQLNNLDWLELIKSKSEELEEAGVKAFQEACNDKYSYMMVILYSNGEISTCNLSDLKTIEKELGNKTALKITEFVSGCKEEVTDEEEAREAIREAIEHRCDIIQMQMYEYLGCSWEYINEDKRKELLQNAHCTDGNGNEVIDGECIVDLSECLAIPGKIVDGEIVIDEKAVIYKSIA